MIIKGLTKDELKELYLALKFVKRNSMLLDSSIWNLTKPLAVLEDYFAESNEDYSDN